MKNKNVTKTEGKKEKFEKPKCVTGAIQHQTAKSVLPIVPVQSKIIRGGFTKENTERKAGAVTEFGDKQTIEFGVYKEAAGYNPIQGKKNKVTFDDFVLYLEGILNGLQVCESDSKIGVVVRNVFVQICDDAYGNSPVNLNERIKVEQNEGDTWEEVKVAVLPGGDGETIQIY